MIFLVCRSRQTINGTLDAQVFYFPKQAPQLLLEQAIKPEFIPPFSTKKGGKLLKFLSTSNAMRRSDNAPISLHATANASATSATGSAWKFPPERISLSALNTSGLSVTPFASLSKINRRIREIGSQTAPPPPQKTPPLEPWGRGACGGHLSE